MAETDKRINSTEQEIRRELVVHAVVQGSSDVSTVLTYLLLVKKLERIGDQAKNIFDLADEGVSLVGAPDIDTLIAYRDKVSGMMSDTSEIFADRDADRARASMERDDRLLDEFDALVIEQVHSREEGVQAVPRALLYRYLKRVAANLVNIMGSVVNTVDQLDYFEGDDIEG